MVFGGFGESFVEPRSTKLIVSIICGTTQNG